MVEELYDLRLLLEPALADAMVDEGRRRDIEELGAMVRRKDTLVGAHDRDAWSTQHYSFHRRLQDLSGKRHHARLATHPSSTVTPLGRHTRASSG